MTWIQVWSWLLDETNMPEVPEPSDPEDKAGATAAGVGVPDVPPGMPFCNSCQTHGHSHISFLGCKKHYLA